MIRSLTIYPYFFLLAASTTLVWGLDASSIESQSTGPINVSEEIKDASNQFITKINGQIPDSIISLGDGNVIPNTVFVVDKTQRSLTIWQQSSPTNIKPVRHYPADIGKNQGDKQAKGDHRTPEGIYTFLEKYEGGGLDFSLYGSRAFALNYPNFFDTLLGKTGAGIWLHAVPDTVPLTRGSRGCVVVRNDVIKDVSQFINLGKTPIIIRDAVNYISTDIQQKKLSELNQMIESWKKAWETKNIDSYITFYSDRFRSLNMNKKKWRRYKRDLAEKYNSIHVAITTPAILEQKGQILVKAFQTYESDQHKDFGQKTLYLAYEGSTPKIVGEEWVEVSNPSDASKTYTDANDSSSKHANRN